jgi:hypothetical protein
MGVGVVGLQSQRLAYQIHCHFVVSRLVRGHPQHVHGHRLVGIRPQKLAIDRLSVAQTPRSMVGQGLVQKIG